MTDLTEQQRVELARQARMALDDFLAPAFAMVEADYAEKMITAAASTDPRTPEVIARLANAIKASRQAHNAIKLLVADGDLAKSQMIRAERIEEMSPARKRLLNIGQA